ncbi:hypothetical protein G6F65_014490 [Rhizopus arrhizus]|nr:hypothetical protein G6F65_014490 [Rhizopus arrhizus]
MPQGGRALCAIGSFESVLRVFPQAFGFRQLGAARVRQRHAAAAAIAFVARHLHVAVPFQWFQVVRQRGTVQHHGARQVSHRRRAGARDVDQDGMLRDFQAAGRQHRVIQLRHAPGRFAQRGAVADQGIRNDGGDGRLGGGHGGGDGKLGRARPLRYCRARLASSPILTGIGICT